MKVWSYLAQRPEYYPSAKILSSDEEKEKTSNLLIQFLSSGLFDNVTDMDYRMRVFSFLCTSVFP